MARLAQRLAGPTAMAGAATTIYTAPAASQTFTKAVLRQIHFFNPGSANTVTVSIGADSANTRILTNFSIPGNSPYDLNLADLAIEPGEVVQAAAGGGGGNVTITLIGAIVTPTS